LGRSIRYFFFLSISFYHMYFCIVCFLHLSIVFVLLSVSFLHAP
jgi:hypothetical protein